MKIVPRLAICALVAFGLLPRTGLGADSASIVWSPAGVRVTVNGAANKDYAVEWCGDLAAGQWNTLATGATGSTGQYLAADAGSVGQTSRFYRARALPPISPTTVYSNAAFGSAQTITLGGSDPLGGILQAFIDKLPTAGKLEQFDGTPISRTNTLVTDSQNRVIYVQGSSTVDYADSFAYHLRRSSNGVTSATQTVALFVGTALPVLDNSRVHTLEDTAVIFQLTATYPDPRETLTYKVLVPTQVGRLYQVAADNQTRGAVISPGAQNVVVTNPSGYLCYLPYSNESGTPYESFLWTAYDSHGASGGLGTKYIDVDPVDDPPTITGTVYGLRQWEFPVSFDLGLSDIDSTNLTVYFTSLPEKGTLYYGNDAVAGNQVAVGQAYSGSRFTYQLAQPGDYGNDYAHFGYYVQDDQGLSATAPANTINISYNYTPPTPTPGPGYQVTQNSNVVITLSATDPDDPTGKYFVYYLTALPQHGKLYLFYMNAYVDLSAVTLPLAFPAPPVRVKYIPNSGYVGSDSFSYTVSDQGHYALAPGVVNLNMVPAPGASVVGDKASKPGAAARAVQPPDGR